MERLGAAKLTIELSDGVITAIHEDGTVLYRGTADRDSWDTVIAGIRASCRDGKGPMVGK